MAFTPQTLTTGSVYMGGDGSHNGTFTGLSTFITIRVGAMTVGAVQSIAITEARQITPIDEVGTDGHIDSAPSKSTDITGTCTRIRFNGLRLTEAFGCDYLHIHSQRIPFNIDIADSWQGTANVVITTLQNVWFNNINYTYANSNWIVTETANFMAERIYTTVSGKKASTGGMISAKTRLDTIEENSDTGGFGNMSVTGTAGLYADYWSNVT